MLGQKGLYWVDQRARQITGKLKEPFGGLSVILCGDFGQLPPVNDRAMFRISGSFKTPISVAAEALFKLFHNVLILTKQKRVDCVSLEDELFRDALVRLHDGVNTYADFKLFQTRFSTNVSPTKFNDSLHFFYKREDSANHNAKKLYELKQAPATFKAEHSGLNAKKAPPQEANNLTPETPRLCY